MASDDRPLLWQGYDENGIECHLGLEQWQEHVEKRPEIADCFALTVQALHQASLEVPDNRRPDENGRRFRFIALPDPQRPGYELWVSVKYVRQKEGQWIKFYQSCWYSRVK